MNKKKLFLGFFLICVSFLAGRSYVLSEEKKGYTGPDMKLRFFEGIKEAVAEPPKIITSSYLRSTVTASIQSEVDLAEEQKQIKKIFNLKDVRLLTEADLKWPEKESDKIFHIFRLDSKEYLTLITPVDFRLRRQFRIEVFEQGEKDKKNLLDTEIILPSRNIAVFGFEDAQGKPYFLSFGVLVKGVVAGVPRAAASAKEIEEFEKGAVKAVGEIKPPRLLKKVDPIYPEEARKEKVEGVVILEVRTDEKGFVEKVLVLKSIPMLDQAAIDAIRQWEYEPTIIGGKPRPMIFTVTVSFRLK